MDFGALFRAYLYSDPVWNNGISSGSSVVSFTLPTSVSPVYKVVKEPSPYPESRHTTLQVVERYLKEDKSIESNDEYKERALKKKIEAYNSIARGMEIILHEDGINFGGNIVVNLNLRQRINVVEGVFPPPVHVIGNNARADLTPLVTINWFNLSPNTTETVFIVSKTTARQTIVKLFKKLKIIDYPKRFSLYEYEQQIDEVAGTLTKKLTRISDDACPLKIIINRNIAHCDLALVLMENDDGGITSLSHESPLRDVFMKVTGLKEEQVSFQMQHNPQTGLVVTTFSKRNALFSHRAVFLVFVFIIWSFMTILLIVAMYNGVPTRQLNCNY